MIDKYFPVHDYGFIALKDVMGNDSSIVQAARVSYGKGTKKLSDDASLINYLMRHDHGTPLEMVDFKFHIGMPIFVHRQLVRTRIASMNEYSGRYSVMPLLFYRPQRLYLKKQSIKNKQGREEDLWVEEVEEINSGFNHIKSIVSSFYHKLLNIGLTRELARIDLPLSTYTYFYWKINLRSLFNFLKLRLDSHAQQEIRDYAKIIAGMVKEICPLAWEAFEKYELYSVKFTQEELSLLDELCLRNGVGFNTVLACSSLSKREQEEFKQKIIPKEKIDYTLDHSLAQSAEYYEALINKHAVEV